MQCNEIESNEKNEPISGIYVCCHFSVFYTRSASTLSLCGYIFYTSIRNFSIYDPDLVSKHCWNLPNQMLRKTVSGHTSLFAVVVGCLQLVFNQKSTTEKTSLWNSSFNQNLCGHIDRFENEKLQLFSSLLNLVVGTFLVELINEYFTIWNYWCWQWPNGHTQQFVALQCWLWHVFLGR